MGLFRKKAERTVTVRRVRKPDGQAAATPRTDRSSTRQSDRRRSGGGRSNTARSGQRRSGSAKTTNRARSSPSGKQAQRSDRGRNGRSNRQTGQGSQRKRSDQSRSSRRRPHLEVVPPPETARQQMLVRTNPHQTQIVVLEGPLLVEHYVTRSEQQSLVGNVYVGKVRNVLPGMEAAFVDFGEGKNGVLYAGDVDYADLDVEGRKPRIERALRLGDSVQVRVVKDPMGHKGARLTSQISLSGRYLVLSSDPDIRGISRRLPEDERKRLRDLIAELRPKGMGIIVRTAAEGASRDDLESDIARLKKTWGDIQSKRDTPAPALIYQEPDLVLRVIREHFTKDFRRLLIDDRNTHDMVVEYLRKTEPDLVGKVRFYEDEMSLFERFHVEDQLRRALDRKVWLPSGGHIVVDRTEALTVIDVNTGRFVGHSNLEETVLQNNLEAAEEVARQLRLRDIGGIIVIDFIDMEIASSQAKVLQKFREELARDKRRTQVFDVSNLGLVEMTRKSVSAGLLESFSDVCDQCNGRGVLLHEDAATVGAPLPGSD